MWCCIAETNHFRVAIELFTAAVCCIAGTSNASPSNLDLIDKVCIGPNICVGRGVSPEALGQYFGLKPQFRGDDGFLATCIVALDKFYLVTYSKQGKPQLQPGALDVSLQKLAGCDRPQRATQHLDSLVGPIPFDLTESTVIEHLGMPAERWTGPNAAYELLAGQYGLLYRGRSDERFFLVIFQSGRVIRFMGSSIP